MYWRSYTSSVCSTGVMKELMLTGSVCMSPHISPAASVECLDLSASIVASCPGLCSELGATVKYCVNERNPQTAHSLIHSVRHM